MTDDGARRAGAFFGRRKGKKLRAGPGRPVRNAAARACGSTPAGTSPIRRPVRARGGRGLARDRLWRRRAPAGPRARQSPTWGSSAASPSSTAWPRCWPPSRPKASTISGSTTATRATSSTRCLPPPVAGLPALSRSLAQAAAQQAALRVRRRCWRRLARIMRPGARFCFASDIDHYVGWTLARVAAIARFRLDGASRGRLAPALRGLAGHALRGQGISRGPNSELPGVSALVGRLALTPRIA